MKKLSAFFFAMLMTVALTITAAAADSIYIIANEYKDCGENVNPALQTGADGDMTSVALKPYDNETAATCWYTYDITLPVDTSSVTFEFTYSTSGVRYMDFLFNGQTHRITFPDSGGFTFFEKYAVELPGASAGTYEIKMMAPSDFNNDDIKTPNIDAIEITWVAAPQSEPEPELTPEPEIELKPEQPVAAPQTADYGIVLITMSAVISLAGYAIIKKH